MAAESKPPSQPPSQPTPASPPPRRNPLLPYLLALLILTIIAALAITPLQRMLRSPRQTGIAFAKALEGNDQAAVRTLAQGTDAQFEFVGGMSAWTVAYQNYELAFARVFSGDQKPFLENSGKMVAQMQNADQTIDGRSATLAVKGGSQTLRFTRYHGQWMLDLSSLCTDDDAGKQIKKLQGLADAYDASRADLEAGKARTPQEARLQLKDRIDSVLFTGYRYELKPEHGESPTTLPAT
jgi:hypothetical protein